MIKHIYANGDSFTFAQELEDKHTEKADFFTHTNYMQKNGYVGLLAQHYNIPGYTNDARPGGSNDRIVRTTVDGVLKLLNTYQPSEIFVLISFTDPSRREFYQSDENRYINYLNNSKPSASEKESFRKFWDCYTAYFDDDRENAARFSYQIICLQAFLKQMGIPYLFTNALYCFSQWEPEASLISNDVKKAIDMKRYPSQPFCSYAHKLGLKFGKDGHPLEEGHRAWAMYLSGYIDENKLMP